MKTTRRELLLKVFGLGIGAVAATAITPLPQANAAQPQVTQVFPAQTYELAAAQPIRKGVATQASLVNIPQLNISTCALLSD